MQIEDSDDEGEDDSNRERENIATQLFDGDEVSLILATTVPNLTDLFKFSTLFSQLHGHCLLIPYPFWHILKK